MGTGFSEDVSHILFGVCHGRCARAMARGLEVCVLEDDNTRSITGSRCDSFEGVHWTGFVDGDCPWDLSLGHSLVMGKFDGVGVLGGLWMVFLWGPCRGDSRGHPSRNSY